MNSDRERAVCDFVWEMLGTKDVRGEDKQNMICDCRYTSAKKWCKIILQHS